MSTRAPTRGIRSTAAVRDMLGNSLAARVPGRRVSLKTKNAINSATNDSIDASAPTPHGCCLKSARPK